MPTTPATTLAAPIVLHNCYVICDGNCASEFRTVTDGYAAYAHDTTETAAWSRSVRPGEIRAACPYVNPVNGVQCFGEIAVDLTSDWWTAATPELLALFANAKPIESD